MRGHPLEKMLGGKEYGSPLFRNPNPEEPFREPIAKLAKLITDRTPVVLGLEKIDKESPEYIGLSMM